MARALLSLCILVAAVAFLPPVLADLAGYRPDPSRVRHDGS